MKRLFITFAFVGIAGSALAQSYEQELLEHRFQYKAGFAADPNGPVHGHDTAYIKFYAPDPQYKVLATFKPAPGGEVFSIPTHNGKTKQYRQYGIVSFKLKNKALKLHIYQSVNQAMSYLFLPFTDETSNKETYGGGRYLDITPDEIKDGKILLDFNKCYNPYCAYGGSYSCPIPPKENSLPIAIKAGEKMFEKEVY